MTTLTDVQLGLVTVTVCGLLSTLIVLVALDVRVNVSFAPLQRLVAPVVALFTDQAPACSTCGATAKPLGKQGDEPWFYCEACGRMWPESDPQFGKAVAS